MNDCDQDHPADLLLHCQQRTHPLGFVAMRNYLLRKYCTDRFVEAKGSGIATSTESQQDADDKALEKAIEHADKKLKVKVRCLVMLARWMGFDMYPAPDLVNERFDLIAPKLAGWNGVIDKKPWQYKITAAIPHLETIEPLKVCIEVLRHQTERPYIIVVDTGSSAKVRKELEGMRADDLEVSFIASHAYEHSSEPVAVALDVAQAMCRSEYIFHTHADCFLRRLDFLEDSLRLCQNVSPVVGYRMSPRDWLTPDWEWMVGHTALLMHMPTINKAGLTWSMQRMKTQYGLPLHGTCGGWPDTETGFNYAMRDAGIEPYFIGDDENYKRQTDRNIDHVRSYAGATIYCEEHLARATPWMRDAIRDAKALVNET